MFEELKEVIIAGNIDEVQEYVKSIRVSELNTKDVDGNLLFHVYDEVKGYIQDVSELILPERKLNCFSEGNWNGNACINYSQLWKSQYL